jgi:hypothetical protein
MSINKSPPYVFVPLIQKAETTEDAYNLLNIDATVKDFFEHYYVDRKYSEIKKLKLELKHTHARAKILFSGPRGSGKTTELHNVAAQLENDGLFVVFLAIAEENLNLSDIYSTDIILLLIRRAFQMITDKSVKLDSSVTETLENLLGKLARQLNISTVREKSAKWKIEAYMDAIFGAGGSLSADYQSREIVRKKSTIMIQQLIKIFNEIVSSVVSTTHKKMIIIMDDLEKVTNYDKILELLDKYHAYIDNLDCSIVLTIPPSLMTDPAFSQLSRAYNRYFLPLFQVRDKYGNENTEQIRLMQEIIKKRIADNLIHSEVIRLAALRSGGLITDFIRMLAGCCVKSLSRNLSRVDIETLKESFNEIVDDFDLTVKDMHHDKLKNTYNFKTATEDKLLAELLYLLAILEYKEIKIHRWYDIHPAVEVVLKNRGVI